MSFQNVSFSYDGEDPPVLQNISFEVSPGTRVGIASPSGTGKTTLVSLLTRFYDPTSGRITLDGVDIRDYKLADLRNQFAIALQGRVLFSTSIAENIAYANPDATSEEIVAAAQAANAHEFITNLPEGYDTLVGERGMRLSRGERQRISLARAFLKDAPILILDEPTSSAKTQATIMEAMIRLMHGRTTFMMAYSPSILEQCDVRLTIEQRRQITTTDEVEEAFAQQLQDHFGRTVRIAEPPSRSFDIFMCTHPIFRLNLTFDCGEQLTAIFKRLQQPGADKDLRREALIYSQLLGGGRFDAPTVYASHSDEARGQYWLLLEDVGDWKLDWCDLGEHDWPAAFRWLARMHAAYYGREEELKALGCLGEHGPSYYRFLARGAREMLQWLDARRALIRFDRLMTRWLDVLIEHLAHQPRTLVHGDLGSSNLMVQPGPRIRPIDWEYAAIGVPGWDVTKLVAGLGPEKRSRFIRVYLDEFALRATAPLDQRAFERTLAYCEIMRTVQVLSWWEGPYDNLAFVEGILDQMESACHYLDSDESNG